MSFGKLLIKVSLVNLAAYFVMMVIILACGQDAAIAAVGALAASCFFLMNVRFEQLVGHLERKLEQSNSPQ